MAFYFPYNFYPVTGKIKRNGITTTPRYLFSDATTSDNDYPTTASLARHDVWQKETYSGHIDVTFTTETPTLVGNAHTSNYKAPTLVEPYRWQGKLALPANSLRGMIASIAEILSQSTLRIVGERYHPAFKAIDADLTPWKGSRTHLTPAELLLGVVDADGTNPDETQNLASRVYFHDAILQNESNQSVTEEIILKELSSPPVNGEIKKIGPEAPNKEAFNTHWKNATHQNVIDYLADENKNALPPPPLGRKFYLNRKDLTQELYEEVDSRKIGDRNMKGQLVKAHQSFKGRISFKNLSKAELTLLKTSIQPDAIFQHQIGLGKPLGLGRLSIKVEQPSIIDHKDRYSRTALLQTPKQPIPINDDPSLIDEDSLKIIIMANNSEHLPSAQKVRWRNGQNEETRPMPQINAQQRRLPIAVENGTSQPEPSLEEQSDIAQEENLALDTLTSPEATWLKGKLGSLFNNKAYNQIPPEQVNIFLKGKALSGKWDGIDDADLKTSVLNLIKKELKARGINKTDLSNKAQERYFS